LIGFCGVTVASWIFYVANGKKLIPYTVIFLTKIIICISTEKVLCITRLENVFASACTCDASADASAPTNRARSCKMTFSSLVIQITTYFHFIVSFNDLDFFFFHIDVPTSKI
jgi:hypothetical protein